jgi:hypothetical protein
LEVKQEAVREEVRKEAGVGSKLGGEARGGEGSSKAGSGVGWLKWMGRGLKSKSPKVQAESPILPHWGSQFVMWLRACM